jgi:hypothetical protein
MSDKINAEIAGHSTYICGEDASIVPPYLSSLLVPRYKGMIGHSPAYNKLNSIGVDAKNPFIA